MRILYDTAGLSPCIKLFCKPCILYYLFKPMWIVPSLSGNKPNETWEIKESRMNTTSNYHLRLSHISELLSLSASADCHSCYLGCCGRCNGLCYLHCLSLFIWPVLSLVLSGKVPPPSQRWPAAAPEKGAQWGQGGAGLGHHVAQEMAALCSLAFIRSAAMLEDLRSGSTLRS